MCHHICCCFYFCLLRSLVFDIIFSCLQHLGWQQFVNVLYKQIWLDLIWAVLVVLSRPGLCGEARGRPSALSDRWDRWTLRLLHLHRDVLLRPDGHDQEHLRGNLCRSCCGSVEFDCFFMRSHAWSVHGQDSEPRIVSDQHHNGLTL